MVEDEEDLFDEEWLKENPPFAGPYEFARDVEIELKIANDKGRKIEIGTGCQDKDKQGSRQGDSYVPGSGWGYGHFSD